MKRIPFLLFAMIFVYILSGCQSKAKITVAEANVSSPASPSEQPQYTLEDILAKSDPASQEPPSAPERPVLESVPDNEDVLEISEKMYLTQIQDIFLNISEYKDKTIVVEGMYGLLFNPDGIQNTPAVYRRGPGCCGNDGWGGFLLHYDGTYPDENAWIRVTGTPEIVENGSFQDLYLNVSQLEVLETRGEEFVTQ